MAISPRSKGLGNIGNIVNRQRMAAPTRPQPQVVQRPKVAAPVVKRPMPMSSPRPQTAKLNPMTEWARNHPTNPSAPGLPDGQTTPPTGTIPGTMVGGAPAYREVNLDTMPVINQLFNNRSNGPGDINFNQQGPGYFPPPDSINYDFGPGEMINQYGLPDSSGQDGGFLGPPPGSSVVQWRQNPTTGSWESYNPQANTMFNGGMNNMPKYDMPNAADYNMNNQTPNTFFNNLSNGVNPLNQDQTNQIRNSLQTAFNPNGTTNNSSGSLFGGGGFANY